MRKMETLVRPGSPLFSDHPQREALQAEAHSRPPLSISAPNAEIWHWVLTDVDQTADWAGQVDRLTRHRVVEVEDGLVRVERHTEFVAITFLGDTAPSEATRKMLRECHGTLLAGQRIVIRERNTPELAERLFHSNRQFGGRLIDPDIRIRSDFTTGPDSMVDYLVEGKFHDADERGQIIKWLIDLECYRTASLLSLPLVRESQLHLRALEDKSTTLISDLTSGGVEDHLIVDELAELLSKTNKLRADLRFRIAASKAYYELVEDRLRILKQRPEQGRLTLEGFVEHRLTPAIKTVFAFERRLDALVQQVSTVMDLARTRIEHRVQLQNQQFLASMDRKVHQQVHLAQAVEGLSVAAITYYIVSLIAKLLEILPDFGVSDKWATGVSIPLVALGVWAAARRARKAIEDL